MSEVSWKPTSEAGESFRLPYTKHSSQVRLEPYTVPLRGILATPSSGFGLRGLGAFIAGRVENAASWIEITAPFCQHPTGDLLKLELVVTTLPKRLSVGGSLSLCLSLHSSPDPWTESPRRHRTLRVIFSTPILSDRPNENLTHRWVGEGCAGVSGSDGESRDQPSFRVAILFTWPDVDGAR